MSAGGLSYSGLVNHGKISLPSVESWGTNMNILRDPPKSIHTRRVEKVGETNSIAQMIDDSGGRVNEAIQVYARGVNPFVSVSYNNDGNNGGQQSGGITVGGVQSAKLPYKIMRDGAFRPPILLQEDLVPLSRIPRGRTSAISNAGFTDFSRKLREVGDAKDTKEVKTTKINGTIRPTAVYRIDRSAQKPFEVKYVIQPFIKTSVNSGIRTMDITQIEGGKPTKEIGDNNLHAWAQANYTDVRHVDNNILNTDRYTQEPLTHSVVSNIYNGRNYTADSSEMSTGRYMQDPLTHSVVSNIYNGKNYTDSSEMNTDRFVQDSLVHPVFTNIYNGRNYTVDSSEMSTGRYMQDTLTHQVSSNICDNRNYTNSSELNTGRFMQDSLTHSVVSNISSKNNHTSIEDISDLSSHPVHDEIRNYSVSAPFSGVEKTNYIHDDIVLSRMLPAHSNNTNIGNKTFHKRSEYDNQIELTRNIPKTSVISNPIARGNVDNSSREARLASKIKAGGYSVPGQIPGKLMMRDEENTKESDKSKIGRKVMESMQGRFEKPASFN